MRVFRPRRRGLWRLMLLGVIVLILGSYVTPVRSYFEKSSVIKREQAITGDLRVERDRLLQEKESLQNNSGYMEQVARKDLGMVKPGEQPYVVKDLNSPESAIAAEPPVAEDPPLMDRIMDTFSSLIP